MNSKNTTPPHCVNRPYNAATFYRIISKMKDEDVFNVSIEVWAEDGPRQLELLRSGLSGPEFEKMAKKATRMLFIGPRTVLNAIGAV